MELPQPAMQEASHAIKVKEGQDTDEFVITRHSQFDPPINIINVYGESECRNSHIEIQARFSRLVQEIKRIESVGEYIVVCGDLNKHVGNLVPGNHSKISYGGALVRDFISFNPYVLLNSHPKSEGGPFTRYDPSIPNDISAKSCLDMIIVSEELSKYVSKVTVDKEFKMTPFVPLPNNKKRFSDHYALLCVFENLPLRQNIGRKKKGKAENVEP